MRTLNVLVYPAGTEVAFEIFHALKDSKFVRLFGANTLPDSAGLLFEHYVEGVPFAGEEGVVEALNKLVDLWDIDYVFPAHDAAITQLAEHRDELHCKLAASPTETVVVCRSKARTYARLAGEPFVPRTYAGVDDIDAYPVFVKPAVGNASRGASIANDEDELRYLLAHASGEMVIAEYLPGEEYTVDCLTDAEGKLLCALPRDRQRMRGGISVRSASVEPDEGITAIAESLNAHFDFRGAWFFQAKRNVKGEWRLLEASPRIPGTMCVSRNRGVNFCLLTLYILEGEKVSVAINDGTVMVERALANRFVTSVAFDRAYIDLDDTLTLPTGGVNLTALSFCHQVRESGRELVLLTRHEHDGIHTNSIAEELDRIHVAPSLFTRIVSVGASEHKADLIDPEKAILIDDSFAERADVRAKLGIPVYDVDMIESLIDWRR